MEMFFWKNWKNKQDGFILYEVMLAVAILGIGLVAVLSSFSSTLNAAGISRDYSKASSLLEQKIWEVEMAGAASPGITRGEFRDLSPDFNWEIEAIEDERFSGEGLLVTIVRIKWGDKDRQREINAATLMPAKERSEDVSF